MMNKLPSWASDIRWTKLSQFEYVEATTHADDIKKTMQSASDESDEEWLAQLERDYATARRRQRKWNSLERGLIISLVLSIAIIVCLASVMIYSSYNTEEIPGTLEDEICQSKGCVSAAYSIMNYVDEKINPCDDFYGYACGNWIKNAFVPPGRSKWTAFHQVLDNNLIVLKKILDRQHLGLNDTSVIRKVKDYYSACMNQTAREKNTAQSLKDLIHFVGSWTVSNVQSPNEDSDNKTISVTWSPDTWNFDQALSKLHKLKSTPLFYMFVSADDKNSSQNAVQVQQAGITLSDPDYYNRNETDEVVQAYKKFMVRIGVLLGGDPNDTQSKMDKVFDFERSLANIYEPKEKLRQTEKIYHKMTIADLQKLAPAIPWMDYMNNMFSNPVTYEEQVVVYTPDYLKNMSDLVTKTERSVLADYMVWHLIKPLMSIMSKPFRQASMDFLKVEKGIDGGASTWKTCVTKTDSVFGFATGLLFVKENEGKDVKSQAETMITAIKETFRANLPEVKWMDSETKIKAVEKADAVFDMIGYPKWIENPDKLDEYYADLVVNPFSNFDNDINARRFYHQRTMNRRRKSVDRREWHMTPAEVNAYYNSPNNYIAFPSGILQRPFFDPDFPQSINFGAVGVVMGHELTHGFDNQGRLFDKKGNLVDWWKNESVVAFQEHTKCMVEQYENFTFAGKKVDGKQTLAENIADNGGLKISYKAYKTWQEDNGPEMMLPGFNLTSEQLFFIGYAQVWCAAATESATQHSLLVDKHSPEKVRVLAAVANSEEFGKAFGCPADSPMNPTMKCQVW